MPAELSPAWFQLQRQTYHPLKDSSPVERHSIEIGLKFLTLLERVMAMPPVPDEVEILKHYVGNDQCPTCRGKKRVGINRIREKDGSSFHQLQLCWCAKPKESEYALLEKKVAELTEALNRVAGEQVNLRTVLVEQNDISRQNLMILDYNLHRIDRHTVGYWISKAVSEFKRWLFTTRLMITIASFTKKKATAAPSQDTTPAPDVDTTAAPEEVRQPAQQG